MKANEAIWKGQNVILDSYVALAKVLDKYGQPSDEDGIRDLVSRLQADISEVDCDWPCEVHNVGEPEEPTSEEMWSEERQQKGTSNK